MATGVLTNVTAVDRVSHYNSGLFYWPDDPERLGFTALIGGESHPFSMDLDGRHKRDLSGGDAGFTYGFSASPDGSRIAYHRDYQVYLADADGGGATRVDTGHPFNFAPQWSPDGRWLVFVSGEHYNCHPYVVGADGSRSMCRGLMPETSRRVFRHEYPFAWFGIMAECPRAADELIYCRSDRGFALISQRTPTIQRMYLQCSPGMAVDEWSDEQIWEEFAARLEGADGLTLTTGPICLLYPSDAADDLLC